MKSFLFVLSILMSIGSLSAAEPQALALPKMIAKAAQYGVQSAFVFDLDETLVDSTPRRFASLVDTVRVVCPTEITHPDCPALRSLRLENLYHMRNRYDDLAYLRLSGVKDPAMVEHVGKDSLARYLSGAYIVEEDRMIPGALAFVRALKAHGAQVFFVTSRSVERQLKPTLAFLRRRGLIQPGQESLLYLKPDSEVSVEFKARASREIAERVAAAQGKVDGIFENEPENITAWAKTFPNARAFFVEGAYMREGTIPSKSVRLRDYRF